MAQFDHGYAPYSRQVLTMPSAWLAKLAVGITVAVAIIHISWTIHGAYEAFPGLLLQELSPLVDDKANLAPLRLASFLALAVTAGHLLRRNNRLLHTPVARLIIRCGQHSLQVFCLGVLLAVLGEILLTSVRDDIAMQLAISLAGIVLMVRRTIQRSCCKRKPGQSWCAIPWLTSRQSTARSSI
jgi:hypothetical protein